jgi:DNA-binding response OmpR family regulator
MQRILVVEDEQKLNDLIRDYLITLGYDVCQSFTGPDAVTAAGQSTFSLIVLDIMLPGFDGIEVIKRVRMAGPVPVIILTARESEADKLLGFEVGADDYLTKPFSIRELGARIRAVLSRTEKRTEENEDLVILRHGVELNCSRRTVKRNGTAVFLTAAQFDLLRILFSHPGYAFSRDELITRLNGCACEGYERTIDVQIKNIRKVLEENPAEPHIIETVWGFGYKVPE